MPTQSRLVARAPVVGVDGADEVLTILVVFESGADLQRISDCWGNTLDGQRARAVVILERGPTRPETLSRAAIA